jgi:hypothetical protein
LLLVAATSIKSVKRIDSSLVSATETLVPAGTFRIEPVQGIGVVRP